MKKLVVLLFAFSCLLGCKLRAPMNSTPSSHDAIDVSPENYPFIAKLRLPSGDCSSVAIAEDVLLTAAHCFQTPGLIDRNPLRVYAPVKIEYFDIANRRFVEGEVKGIVIHPRALLEPALCSKFDLAVLFLSSKVLRPVRLGRTTPIAGDLVQFLGYGQQVPGQKNNLEKLSLGENRIATFSQIVDQLPMGSSEEDFEGLLAIIGEINATQVYEGNERSPPDLWKEANSVTLSGDSGGGLFTQGSLVGIVSRGSIPTRYKVSFFAPIRTQDNEGFVNWALRAASSGDLTPPEQFFQASESSFRRESSDVNPLEQLYRGAERAVNRCDPQLAEEKLTQLMAKLSVNSSRKPWQLRSVLRIRRGQYKLALDELSQVADELEEPAFAFLEMGKVHSRFGRYEEAIQYYSKYLNRFPNDKQEAYLLRSHAYRALGKDDLAQKDFVNHLKNPGRLMEPPID